MKNVESVKEVQKAILPTFYGVQAYGSSYAGTNVIMMKEKSKEHDVHIFQIILIKET